MADTTYLKYIVEPFIVQWVSQRIGLTLHPRRFPVGTRTDGTIAHFEFDGVSEDNQTGLLVSTSYTLKPGGTRKLHGDASTLLNAGFQRRIMVFVSDEVRQNFLNKCDGLLQLSKVEMLVCDELPLEMREQIAKFQSEAKIEVGDKGKLWKLGGQRS